jgi:long-chain acyl-CoA synthetase
MMSRVLAALAEHARLKPDASAIIGSRQTLGWQALATSVERLSARLAGVRVFGLLYANSPGWIIADLAALHAGCTHVPLPAFFSDEQLRHAIVDACIDTLITDNPSRITRLFPDCILEILELAGQSCACIRLPANDSDCAGTAKITYTSGTTGAPHGVRLALAAQEAVATSLLAVVQADHNDRACVLMPLSILLENIGSVYVPLLAGATIVVPDPGQSGVHGSCQVDAQQLETMLHRYRPSTLIVPPALLKLLVQVARRKALPASLRFIAVGGAPTGTDLLQQAQQLGLPVFQGYGLSEAASVVALNTPQHNRPGSVGKSLPHCQVHISDSGEVLVAGITSDPAEAREDLLFATGDLGYLDADGYLFVTGRRCNRIITSYGRNVSPEWIEAQLTAHPEIRQAVVLGSQRPSLAAVLVAADGVRRQQLGRIVQALNACLPDYARIDEWQVADAPFSTASGELSASGSIRRDVVEQRHFGRPANATGNAHG